MSKAYESLFLSQMMLLNYIILVSGFWNCHDR